MMESREVEVVRIAKIKAVNELLHKAEEALCIGIEPTLIILQLAIDVLKGNDEQKKTRSER